MVCGRSETIATLVPTIRLTSVDFPTFGRPTSVTKPERNVTWATHPRPGGPRLDLFFLVGVRAGEPADQDRHDAPALHALAAELEILELHRLPLLGHVPEEVEHEPAHRVPLRVGKLHAELAR